MPPRLETPRSCRSRREARAIPARALVLALLAAACTTPAPPPKPPSVAITSATPVEHRPAGTSRWQAIPIAPSIGESFDAWLDPEGYVVLDDSGVRWLFPARGGVARSVTEVDLHRLTETEADDPRAVRRQTADGRLFGLASALGPEIALGRVPEDARAKPKVLGGAMTVRTARGVLASNDGQSWRPLGSLPGLAMVDALIDAQGRGVALFVGGALGRTQDGGKTFAPLEVGAGSAVSLEPRAGAVFVAPGRAVGELPHEARVVDPASGKSEVAPAGERPSVAQLMIDSTLKWADGGPDWDPSLAPRQGAPGAPRARLALRSGRHDRRRISLDADRLVALALPPAVDDEGSSSWLRPLMVGTLGEGVATFGGVLPPGCRPIAAALCGEDVAVRCEKTIEVYRNEQKLVSLRDDSAHALAFADEQTLVALGQDRKTMRHFVTSYRFGKGGEAPVASVNQIDFHGESLVGGCHRPAMWVSGGGKARRWTDGALGPTLTLPPLSRGEAIDARGELVVASEGKLHFLPSMAQVSPGTLDVSDTFAFAEDGLHGLVLLAGGQMAQTSDGGRRWVPIASPGSANTDTLLCGKQRCQLGSGVFREGFVEDPAFTPAHEDRPSAARPRVPAVALACRREEAPPGRGKAAPKPTSKKRTEPKTFDPTVSITLPDGWMRAAVELDGTTVLLQETHPKQPMRARSFAIRSTQTRETGIGLVGGKSPAVIALEDAPDGGTELRRHPLDASQKVGPGTAIPGAKAAPGELLALPACTARDKGAEARLVIRDASAPTLDGVALRAKIERFLRVSDKGACVDRTVVRASTTEGLSTLTLPGDGARGIRTSENTEPTPLRCEPLVVKAPER